MATTDYRTATTSPRNAQTAINQPSGDRNEVSSVQSSTAIWIIVAIVALAAIAFAMGMFGASDSEMQANPTMATDSTAPREVTPSPMNTAPQAGTPEMTQTTAPGATDSASPAPSTAVNQ